MPVVVTAPDTCPSDSWENPMRPAERWQFLPRRLERVLQKLQLTAPRLLVSVLKTAGMTAICGGLATDYAGRLTADSSEPLPRQVLTSVELTGHFSNPTPHGTGRVSSLTNGPAASVVASLEMRNTESHPLPLSAYPGIVLVDLRTDPPANALDRYYRRKIGSSSLSLPGYSTDGHALVYGSYSCGNVCGYGWLFILAKVRGQWQQKSATVTVIS
jgi:hypothetical protein